MALVPGLLCPAAMIFGLETKFRALWLPAALLPAIGCYFDDGPQPVSPPPVPSQDRCPPGFGPLGDGVEDGCYAALDDADWIAGEDACEEFESEGIPAHLVVVDREPEHEALSRMAPASFEGVWIGRFQTKPETAFRNVNFIEYEPEYFATGEPNDYGERCSLFTCTGYAGIGDERCIEYRSETGLWNDKACSRLGTVVCEWDGVAPYAWRPNE